MRRFTRPLAFVGGAALAVGAVVGLTALPGQAQTTTIVKQNGFSAQGLLVFDAKAKTITRSGSASATQTFATGCPTTIAGGLITVTPVVDSSERNVRLGFDGEKVGVGQNTDSGSGCYVADLRYNQGIKLTFGTAAAPLAVQNMNLDLAFKGNVGLSVSASFGGSPVAVTESGDPRDPNDDGPDCAGCDHYRVAITPDGPIDTLVLKPAAVPGVNDSTASVALSGGYTTDTVDFTGGGAAYSGSGSVFQLVQTPEGTLDCGQTTTNDGVTITHLAAGQVQTGTSSTNGCTGPQPYLITGGGTQQVLVALPGSTGDAYVVKVPFGVETATSTDPNAPYGLTVRTKVDYLLSDGTNPLPDSERVRDLELCDGTYPGPAATPYVNLSMPFDVLPDVPGNQGVCGIERTVTLSSGSAGSVATGNTVTVTETMLIIGDPAFGRLSN